MLTRRELLKGMAALSTMAAFAACTPKGSSTGGGTTSEAATDSETAAPAEKEKPSALEQKREALKKKMDEAVACENFEDAAKYRDQLKLLPTGEEGEVKL